MGAKTKAGVVISVTVIAGTLALIKPSEGRYTHAYADPANPHIASICYGETQGVKFGDVKTPEECDEMLARRLPDYLGPIYELLPDLPDNRAIAYGDAAYNMGVGILTRRSNDVPGTSIVDLEKRGQWPAACKRLLLFVYANGQKLPGLVKRREREYEVCMGSQH